jgi:hypothetical protein
MPILHPSPFTFTLYPESSFFCAPLRSFAAIPHPPQFTLIALIALIQTPKQPRSKMKSLRGLCAFVSPDPEPVEG